MASNDLQQQLQGVQQQLKEVCEQVTRESMDPKLTASEVREYVKVLNSAAHISTGLTGRVERDGIERVQKDILRFIDIALQKILRVRQAVADREGDSLEDAWNADSDEDSLP